MEQLNGQASLPSFVCTMKYLSYFITITMSKFLPSDFFFSLNVSINRVYGFAIADRKSSVKGKSVVMFLILGVRRVIKKKKNKNNMSRCQ